MKIDKKVLVAALVAVGVVTVGCSKKTEEAKPETSAQQAPAGQQPAAQPAGLAADGQPLHQGGVEKFDPTARFTHFRVGNRNVKDILLEGDKVWVGTSGGLIRYEPSKSEYRLFDARNGLLSNGVFHVSRLDGKITVGTYGGGMSMYDEEKDKWENFNIPDGLGDAFIYDVLKAANGDVWIATWSGANRVRGGSLRDPSKWELYTVENTKGGLPNDWVYGLAEGKNGDIWLATEGGLALYRNGKWDNWNHKKGQGAAYDIVKDDIAFKNDPAKQSVHHARQKEEMGLQDVSTAYNPNYIVSIVVDKEGIVWVGTWGGGLARFDGKNFRNYTTKDGLPGNHVFMLHQEASGKMWVGTNNGLASMEGDKFTPLGTQEGLFSPYVFSMATSPDGHKWVGSYGGVSHLSPTP